MRGFVLVNHGVKYVEHMKQAIRCIKKYSEYPITVWTDVPTGVKNEVVYPPREFKKDKHYGINNILCARTEAILKSEYDELCYLDSDIFIVHKGFMQGFEMLEKYPLMFPQNPRWFVTSEEGIGDSECGSNIAKRDKKKLRDLPQYLTAWNGGVQFVRKCEETVVFYNSLLNKSKEGGRNQAKMAITAWETGVYPYVLPPNWCVCQEHPDIQVPLALHCSHGVVFERWKRDYEAIH